MAVTSRAIGGGRRAWNRNNRMQHAVYVALYGAALMLGALAIYALIGALLGRVAVMIDDIRYGYPRTMHVQAFVGHGEEAGHPTHLIAINLDRQVVVLELPGGDPSQVRSITGPYLFGADEHLTPVTISVQDVDGDTLPDLLLDIRREWIVYLNRDGLFRLPTPEEQAHLTKTLRP
ncbi:MAG: hypothetical protein ACUVSY_14955 [Roseiflexus sp.]